MKDSTPSVNSEEKTAKKVTKKPSKGLEDVVKMLEEEGE
jgi:hypothetical protein